MQSMHSIQSRGADPVEAVFRGDGPNAGLLFLAIWSKTRQVALPKTRHELIVYSIQNRDDRMLLHTEEAFFGNLAVRCGCKAAWPSSFSISISALRDASIKFISLYPYGRWSQLKRTENQSTQNWASCSWT